VSKLIGYGDLLTIDYLLLTNQQQAKLSITLLINLLLIGHN